VQTRAAAAVAGQRDTATVRVRNDGNQKLNRTVSLAVYLSPDPVIDSGDRQVVFREKKLSIKAGKSHKLEFKFTYPEDAPPGAYYVLAQADLQNTIVERAEDNNVGMGNPVVLAPPLIDLSGTFKNSISNLGRSKSKNVSLRLRADGNTSATGRITIQLFASADGVLDAGDILIGQLTDRSIDLAPGKGKTLKIKAKAPESLPAGNYTLIAFIDATAVFAETNEANNAVVGSSVTVS
jgi:subtilase family serine protease